MAFRYLRGERECIAQDIGDLERALRAGELEKTTLVLDDSVGVRLQAGALIAMKRKDAAGAPGVPTAKAPAPQVAASAPVETKSSRVRNQRILATLTAILVGFVVLEIGRVPPTIISDFTGAVLVVLAVVVLVSGWIFGRKTEGQRVRQAWVGAGTWVLAWLALSVWVGSIRDDHVAAERSTAKALAESTRRTAAEIDAIVNDKTPPAALPDTSAPGPAPAPGKGGFFQRIAPIVSEAHASAIRETREFKVFQDSLHLETVLAPENLTSVEGRKRGSETIDRYLAGYEAHHQRLVDKLSTQREKLMATMGNENPEERAGFAKGMETSMMATMDSYEEMRKIERGVAAQMHAITDFVAARGSTVQLRDGKIVFATQADVDGYQRLVDGLLQLGKQEDELSQRQMARGKQAAERIEGIAPK
jgi:hypothetical protein